MKNNCKKPLIIADEYVTKALGVNNKHEEGNKNLSMCQNPT